jgi:hypothetical protein
MRCLLGGIGGIGGCLFGGIGGSLR